MRIPPRPASLTILALVLVAAGILPARAQDPLRTEYERLTRLGTQAISERRYDEAIAAFEKCLQLDENDNTSAYNLACCYSLKGSKEEGVRWLKKAFELGFTDWQHTEADSDLDNLRGEPGYKDLVERMKTEAARNEVREYALHVPSSYDGSRSFPILVALHGSHGREDGMVAMWRGLAESKGVILLAVRGTIRVRDRAFRWDERSESTILGILNEVRDKVKVDPGRVYVTGVGQGAYIAYTIALHSPDLIRAVVTFASLYPPQLEYNFSEAKKHGLGVYIVHSSLDVEKIANARTASQKLKDAGVTCEFREHSGSQDVPTEDWPAHAARIWEWIEALPAKAGPR